MELSQNQNNKRLPERYPENVQGDFYVENEVCTSCGAPEAEAPDLIEHSKKGYTHCYFKKQPETTEELERAISALQVSCISGIRYGGKDEKILYRLFELGEDSQSDYLPEAIAQNGCPSKVSFCFVGNMNALYTPMAKAICSSIDVMEQEILNYYADDNTYFEFTYRPINMKLRSIRFKGVHIAADKYTIVLNRGGDCPLIQLFNNAAFLHNYLSNNRHVSQITWYNENGNIWNPPQ